MTQEEKMTQAINFYLVSLSKENPLTKRPSYMTWQSKRTISLSTCEKIWDLISNSGKKGKIAKDVDGGRWDTSTLVWTSRRNPWLSWKKLGHKRIFEDPFKVLESKKKK